jgi:hypothetical protein
MCERNNFLLNLKLSFPLLILPITNIYNIRRNEEIMIFLPP